MKHPEHGFRLNANHIRYTMYTIYNFSYFVLLFTEFRIINNLSKLIFSNPYRIYYISHNVNYLCTRIYRILIYLVYCLHKKILIILPTKQKTRRRTYICLHTTPRLTTACNFFKINLIIVTMFCAGRRWFPSSVWTWFCFIFDWFSILGNWMWNGINTRCLHRCEFLY